MHMHPLESQQCFSGLYLLSTFLLLPIATWRSSVRTCNGKRPQAASEVLADVAWQVLQPCLASPNPLPGKLHDQHPRSRTLSPWDEFQDFEGWKQNCWLSSVSTEGQRLGSAGRRDASRLVRCELLFQQRGPSFGGFQRPLPEAQSQPCRKKST